MITKQIAQILLKKKAVTLSPNKPYTFASGIKSPIYCDNRVLISYPSERSEIINGFVKTIDELGGCDVVAGTATAGIPWAAFVAQQMNKPMLYVRSSNKEHGKGTQVEGRVKPGAKVILLDDLITTGGSVLKAADVLKQMECELVSCLAIFTYGMKKAKDNFKEHGVGLKTLTNLDDLLDKACELEIINSEQKTMVLNWRCDNEK